MKKLALPLLFTLAALSAPQIASSQITVLGGNLLLQVTSAAAPQDPMSVVNSATSLSWNRKNVIQKITVSTSCPGQKFTLKVYALNTSEGIAAPEVTLTNGMPAADFITDCPRGGPRLNTATLRYTASATFSQGNSSEIGNDVHVVTYTILAQ
jgi:hypothetical protein